MRSENAWMLAGLIAWCLLGSPGATLAAPKPRPGNAAAPALTPGQERRAMEELAELYGQEGRTDDALAIYAELRAREPAEAQWWRRPAELLEPLTDRRADLLLVLLGWHAATPTLREPAERLVRFYEEDGAIDEGLKIVDVLLAQTPKDLALRRLKAELLQTGDRTEPAIAAWTQVLALPAATPEDRWQRAELMSLKGDSPALRAEYEALVAAKPEDVRFRVGLGESCLAAEDFTCARKQVDAARAQAPDNAEVKALEAALEREQAERATDRSNDQYDLRDALRWRLDRAERLRALLPQEDY
jgi:predicted Zn-dependent protease